jgi:hypothetical protein
VKLKHLVGCGEKNTGNEKQKLPFILLLIHLPCSDGKKEHLEMGKKEFHRILLPIDTFIM